MSATYYFVWQVRHIFYPSFSSKIIILQQLYGLIALPLDMMITVFNKLVVFFFFFSAIACGYL